MPCRIYKLNFREKKFKFKSVKSGKCLVFIVSGGTFERGLEWELG